jgi:hypothetical protein
LARTLAFVICWVKSGKLIAGPVTFSIGLLSIWFLLSQFGSLAKERVFVSHGQDLSSKRLFLDCNVYACPIPSNLFDNIDVCFWRGHLDCGFSPKVAQTFTLKQAVPANCSFFRHTRPVHPLPSVAQPIMRCGLTMEKTKNAKS